MKNLILITLANLILIILGCSLKQVIYPTTASSDTYQPLTAGSEWAYNLSVAGFSEKATITITGDKKTINGKTYYKSVEVTPDTTQVGYYSHSGSLYTDRNEETDPQDILDEPYLDDSLPINSTYTYKANDTGLSHGSTIQYVGKILEKGITKTVNSKVYTNVIHTHLELQTSTGGSSFQTTEVTEFYVAKGIGIIQLDGYVGGSLFVSQTLVSYNIK